MTLTVGPCVEHSPYWVHLRKWQPKAIPVEADELEGVGRVGHEALGRGAGPLGDEPGIRPGEQQHGGARIEAAQGPLDLSGLDGDHRPRRYTDDPRG